MPIYEYRCLGCNEQFETLVLGGKEDVDCPRCKGRDVERLMSACSFKSSGEGAGPAGTTGSSGCSSCSGTSCATCH